MRHPVSILARFLLVGVLAGVEPAALAVLLDYPGAIATSANGINNAGHIVGNYFLRDALSGSVSGSHGFVYDHGRFATLDVPGSRSTVASGINSQGWIVGSFLDSNRWHGFLYKDRAFTTIDVPGGVSTAAYGINDAGQIVGTAQAFSGERLSYGFLYDNGNLVMLDSHDSTPYSTAAGGTSAYGINNAGQIVGSVQKYPGGLYDCGDFMGRAPCSPFVYRAGTFSILDNLDASSLFRTARGINNIGQIVGGSPSFSYVGGTFTPISSGIDIPHEFSPEFRFSPGFREQANGINDVGQIVGMVGVAGDNAHGFLILIPEPAALIAFTIGLLGLALVCGNRASGLIPSLFRGKRQGKVRG